MARPIRIAHVTTVDGTLRFILLGQLRRLQQEGFDVTAVSARGPYTHELEAHGIRHIHWPHATRAWDPASDVRAFFELLTILRRGRFDIVHSHTPKPNIMGRIAARLVGVPGVVNSVHGYYALPEDPPAKRIPVLALERIAARFSDLELFDSEEDLSWARGIGLVKPSRSLFLGNGVDLERFDPSVLSVDRLATLRRDLGIPESAIVIGAVGRLVAEKGYREFFAAARELRDSMPDTRFVVLGSPDREKADAITETEIERARRDIVFTGWVDDVRDLLGLMDVFVLPSWREGQPVSAIEASAMGKPLILTDIRGCREVVTNEVEGLLIPPRDAKRLTEAIVRLVRDGALRKRLGEAARRRAVARFDEGKIVKKLAGEYRKLLSRKGIPHDHRPSNGVALTPNRSERGQALLKRGLDLMLVVPGIVLIAPLLAVLALLVRLTLGRPVLFRQQRAGHLGKPFTLLKFRTMNNDRDSKDRLLPDGERLRGIGRFLRRTSLDELPTLINVIKGDMSLVGPRPLITDYLDRYSPEQMRRHLVKPGITGWNQINGRNALTWEKKFAQDVWYVDNRSLWLDLKILGRTAGKVLRGHGVSAPGNATMPEFRGLPGR